MKYCGEYFDSETGLIYLRARYYDPAIGRFISEDPVKDGLNWYVYCSNNPVMFVDPLGLAPGDKFKSQDAAVQDWAYNYAADSNYVSFESGSLIYMEEDGNGGVNYIYTEPVWGEPHGVEIGQLAKIVPEDAVITSYVHNHPNNPNFSPDDKQVALKNAMTAYVVYVDDSGADIRKFSDTHRYGYTESVVATDYKVKELSQEWKLFLKNTFQQYWEAHIAKGCEDFQCETHNWPEE